MSLYLSTYSSATLFLMGSHEAQAGLKFKSGWGWPCMPVLLPLPLKYWDYMGIPPCLAFHLTIPTFSICFVRRFPTPREKWQKHLFIPDKEPATDLTKSNLASQCECWGCAQSVGEGPLKGSYITKKPSPAWMLAKSQKLHPCSVCTRVRQVHGSVGWRASSSEVLAAYIILERKMPSESPKFQVSPVRGV